MTKQLIRERDLLRKAYAKLLDEKIKILSNLNDVLLFNQELQQRLEKYEKM